MQRTAKKRFIFKRSYYIKKAVKILVAVLVLIFILTSVVKINGDYVFRYSAKITIEQCTDEDAGKLTHMPFLRELCLLGCQTDNLDFLTDMPRLQEIYINSLNNNYDLSFLESCTELREFRSGGFTFDDLTCFSKMNKLEELDLGLFVVNNIQSLEGLDKLTSLKRLYLSALNENAETELINSLTGLESLWITDSDFEFLEISAPNLNYLNISDNPNLKNVILNGDFDSLEMLVIDDSPNIVFSQLPEFPALKILCVSQGQI
ncbi:MAG: hypothetical protein K2N72_03440, partial [Oscillospiraceae bacterium]|nr:hypothetical protein [Oscillospiraceae bacterium]